MLEELRETLAYPKLAKRVALAGSDADGITAYYAALIQRIEPEIVGRYVPNDPDDDMIVAAAMAAQVTMIISGDRHLFELDGVVAIPVLTPAEAYEVLVGR